MFRVVARTILLSVAVVLSATDAAAQKRCVKGIPCGNTCIAAGKTCRVGSGSATATTAPSPSTPAAVKVPADAQYVASSRGQVYYWVGCSAWKGLSPSNLIFFKTAEEAQKAGYRPSQTRGCAGPAGATQPAANAAAASAASAVPVAPELASLRVCMIVAIVDGDTIDCADGERVRLLLIDAPERDQAPYGPMAALALESILPVGTPARLEFDVQERDRYGRLLAYVYHPDGRLANEAMLEQGYAVVAVYPPNVKYVDRFRAVAARAKDGKYGFWATPAFQCLPEDFRAGRCR